MSQTLARLEARDLVRRRAHPSDGRSRIVVPASRNDHLEGDDVLTDRIRAAAARLTADQGAVVVDFIDELRRIIDDTPPTAPTPGSDD